MQRIEGSLEKSLQNTHSKVDQILWAVCVIFTCKGIIICSINLFITILYYFFEYESYFINCEYRINAIKEEQAENLSFIQK